MDAIKFLNQELSWDSLDKKLKDLTTSKQTKKAGDIFETVVKYYLLTNSKYKSTLINVWLLEEVPAAVKLKLNLPNSDEGIDLIAETKNGHFWAIQAKYRSDPNETLTIGGKGSLATFNNLAFGYCKNISHGLVLTTVSKTPKKIKLINHVGFETLESFLSLDDNNKEEWKSLLAASVGKIIKPKKLEPRPHQVEAIRKAVEYFRTNERGKMIMPCGTGKSLAAFWIAKEMKAKTILIAVPSLALLQQTLKVWTREFLINDISPDWLCVCSDETVKENQDSFVSFTYDLGIEVTTDKNQIKKFLESDTKNIKVIFSTYQSGKVTAAGSQGFVFDLGIMDEAHKTVGHINKPMAHLLNEKNIKIKNRLFMTATERLFRLHQEEYLSMDNVKDYGNIIYELSFKQAINTNPPIISDYKIITFGISEPEINKIYNDNKFLQVRQELKDITAREFATALALRKSIKNLGIKNVISFHSTIKRAKNFKNQQTLITKIYPEYEDLETFHVSAKMPASQRASQMRLFSEKKGLITNARCLTEGVDLPAVDCICFTDPKKSKVDIVQAAGRALRLSPGKKFGYILIPVVVPKNSNPAEISKNREYEEIVTIVGALSTQDARIAEYLKIKTEGKVFSNTSPFDENSYVNFLTEIDPHKFNDAIQLKVWDKIGKINLVSYSEAKKYARALKIKSQLSWYKYIRLNKLPSDMTGSPQRLYINEWEGWGEFLGTGVIGTKVREFISYDEAKKYAQSLKFESVRNWYDYLKIEKLPKNIPNAPEKFYRNEWEGWAKFLGSKIEYRSYEEAKKYAQSLNLKSAKEWAHLSKTKKLPKDIPFAVHNIYKNYWKNWSEFLGTKYIYKKKIKNYNECKKYAQSLNLKGQKEWYQYCKQESFPKNLPKSPPVAYKSEWEGWPYFLNNQEIKRQIWEVKKNQTQLKKIEDKNQKKLLNEFTKKNRFLSYEDAKIFVREANIKNTREYRTFKGRPLNLPSAPDRIYKENWEGWDIFLGTSYRTYEEAKKYVQSLNLKSREDWKILSKQKKLPMDIPTSVEFVYKNEWEGWGKFLGTGRVASQEIIYRSYQEAKQYAQQLKLRSREEWSEHTKSNNFPRKHIPAAPSTSAKYKNEWEGWGEFLGTGNIRKNYNITYNEVKLYAQEQEIKSCKQWEKFCKLKKLRDDIPTQPHIYFKKEWKSWGEFLGTGNISSKLKEFKSYEEAKEYAQSLKLTGQRAWFKLAKLKKIPQGIAINPVKSYKKNWKSWGEFLGNGRISRHSFKFKSYEDAKKFAQSNNIKSSAEWIKLAKKRKLPDDVPHSPDKLNEYKSYWKGWDEFLNNESIKK